LVRLRRNVRRYRERLEDVHVESLADLARLPVTTPEDMAESFPYGMFALPLREVIRLHSAMGPEGTPLVIGHTRNDLSQWARLAARQLAASGVTSHDVIQVCSGTGIYRGGLGYALGAELLGASVIDEDPYHMEAQLAMLSNYRPTMLVTTPSNAQDLMRAMDRQRIDPPSLHLRTMLLSRPVDSAVREQLREGLLVGLQASFGIDEILDPGLCVECEAGHLHVNEDQFLVEIDGGELLVTTLAREAMPLLRYRTRVTATLDHTKCSCERTGAVLKPGPRLDGRLLVNETPLYRSQITQLFAHTGVAGNKFSVEVLESRLTIKIQLTENIFSDMMWPLIKLQRELELEFLDRLGIPAEVRFVQHCE
jgi:phenylacetate-CoA ligase